MLVNITGERTLKYTDLVINEYNTYKEGTYTVTANNRTYLFILSEREVCIMTVKNSLGNDELELAYAGDDLIYGISEQVGCEEDLVFQPITVQTIAYKLG